MFEANDAAVQVADFGIIEEVKDALVDVNFLLGAYAQMNILDYSDDDSISDSDSGSEEDLDNLDIGDEADVYESRTGILAHASPMPLVGRSKRGYLFEPTP